MSLDALKKILKDLLSRKSNAQKATMNQNKLPPLYEEDLNSLMMMDVASVNQVTQAPQKVDFASVNQVTQDPQAGFASADKVTQAPQKFGFTSVNQITQKTGVGCKKMQQTVASTPQTPRWYNLRRHET